MSLSSILSQHIHTLYSIEYIPTLSAPPDTALGEYCFGVFTLAKDVRRPPADIATEVAQHILKDTQHIVSANSVGGYVNIVCTSTVWIDILDGIKNTASPLIPLYPGREGEKNTIIVDYIGANIGKPLHIGHLCTPSIGQSIINIYRHLGYSVISDTHIGDWGLFGKLIAAHKMYGTPTGLADRGVEYLLDLYIRITQAADENPDIDAYVREEFRKLSTGDIENMALW
jgi:arginyl-tRNA synthetase